MTDPTEEQTYRQGIDAKFDRFDRDVRGSLSRIEVAQDALDKNQQYTNGKVRKIIIVLVLVVGVVIGQNFTNMRELISLLAGIVHG